MRPAFAALLALALGSSSSHAQTVPTLRGFSPSESESERRWEARFMAIPRADSVRENMRRLSARPHHLGSPYDRDNAQWMLAKYRSYGLVARIDSFKVLFPTPRERVLELVRPTSFTARLTEPALPEDPTSGQTAEQLPTYNAYSIDGEVTAPLVYANYGIPDDYDQLERMGVSVKGCIVIVRYGAAFRGIKPKVAAEHGAVGCIIYSDPRGDGYFMGDTYPGGAYRPKDGVQRGSVLDMVTHPGDPQTPGWGATEGARRIERKDVDVITRIPVLPISYADATPFMAALRGPMAPESWRGALPLTYHVGPGPATVHLKLAFQWDVVPALDVVATIPGTGRADQWVLRGNHHDGWVNGTSDPISGQAALLEEARALGALYKEGWRPLRTLMFLSWDGEEEGLMGSTEWAEEHAEELQKHAVLYLNSDSNNRGYLSAGGSHILEKFMHEVASDVLDPETGLSVARRLLLQRIKAAASADDRDTLRAAPELRIEALGSGSDYSTFLQHLGVPCLNLGFGGEGDEAQYHSIYDDFHWFSHYADTSFEYGQTLARTSGLAMMRMAGSRSLPYDFENQAATFRRYAVELQKLLKSRQDEARERSKQLAEGLFAATTDPRDPLPVPRALDTPPDIDFKPLLDVTARLADAARGYSAALASAREAPAAELDLVASMVQGSEQRLLGKDGLPRRPWFKHLLYAPGFYTGYGVKTMPGIREALETRNWEEARREMDRVVEALDSEIQLVRQSSAELEAARH